MKHKHIKLFIWIAFVINTLLIFTGWYFNNSLITILTIVIPIIIVFFQVVVIKYYMLKVNAEIIMDLSLFSTGKKVNVNALTPEGNYKLLVLSTKEKYSQNKVKEVVTSCENQMEAGGDCLRKDVKVNTSFKAITQSFIQYKN